MKKLFYVILLNLLVCNITYAESYYFKECKLSSSVTGNYIINFDQNIIEVKLEAVDGTIQNFEDKIKLVEKNKIVSDKIKSAKGEKIYYQYFLNSNNKTVIKLQFVKQSGVDMNVFKLIQKRESYCSEVNGGWNIKKIDKAEITKEKKQILKAQEQIKKEQKSIIECQENDHNKWNNCKGKYTADTGLEYNGIFKNGLIFRGISIYPGGAKYVGDFRNNLPNGYGTFVWANGDKYYGEWKNGKSHGNGTKLWKNGQKYLGEFKEDKLHGSGTLFYPDGKKYTGEFVNGMRHGEGIFTYADGTAYIGKFISGKEEGVGECISKDGLSVPCGGKADTQVKDFSGKDTRDISIVAKKWVRISQYESNSKKGKKIMDKLKSDFETKATELCAAKGNYNVLEKKIEVLEIDETPAYGLETKLKIGINGVIECI